MTAANLPMGESTYEMPALVDTDLPCTVCYHSLRNQPINGTCPKCNTPIELSVGQDLLRFANPKWIDGMRIGIQCILASIGLAFAGLIVVFALALTSHQSQVDRGEMTLVITAAYLMYVLGWWGLTAPDPSGKGEREYGLSRKIIRACVLAGMAGQSFVFVAGSADLGDGVLSEIAKFPALVILGMAALAFVAKFRYLTKLAQRIPDCDLSEKFTFLMWAIGICAGLNIAILIQVKLLLHNNSPTSANMMSLGLFQIITLLALVLLELKFLTALSGLARALKHQADYARDKAALAASGGARPPQAEEFTQ